MPADPLTQAREHLDEARTALREMREYTASLEALAGDRLSGEYLKQTLYRRMMSLRDDPTTPLFFGRIDYRTAAGASGDGQAYPLTTDSGYFWFFDDANVELVIKVIDGCGYNDRYWVFAGGLTNVETHLTVRDTLHPTAVFQKTNPLNQAFAPILSIDAFDTCP